MYVAIYASSSSYLFSFKPLSEALSHLFLYVAFLTLAQWDVVELKKVEKPWEIRGPELKWWRQWSLVGSWECPSCQELSFSCLQMIKDWMKNQPGCV